MENSGSPEEKKVDNQNESEYFLEKTERKGFDILFEYIPAISFYQIFVALASFWVEIPGGAIQVGGVILQAPPGFYPNCLFQPFFCHKNQNYLDDWYCIKENKVQKKEEKKCCEKYGYNHTIFQETIVTEFDLVCDQKYKNR